MKFKLQRFEDVPPDRQMWCTIGGYRTRKDAEDAEDAETAKGHGMRTRIKEAGE
jgi:hypothetical protein